MTPTDTPADDPPDDHQHHPHHATTRPTSVTAPADVAPELHDEDT
ncbi:hypothetical protein [Halorubellus salinus]|nr:hypothetical protein [Halorubellus salinus]